MAPSAWVAAAAAAAGARWRALLLRHHQLRDERLLRCHVLQHGRWRRRLPTSARRSSRSVGGHQSLLPGYRYILVTLVVALTATCHSHAGEPAGHGGQHRKLRNTEHLRHASKSCPTEHEWLLRLLLLLSLVATNTEAHSEQ